MQLSPDILLLLPYAQIFSSATHSQIFCTSYYHIQIIAPSPLGLAHLCWQVKEWHERQGHFNKLHEKSAIPFKTYEVQAACISLLDTSPKQENKRGINISFNHVNISSKMKLKKTYLKTHHIT
jgi:hypothetical protein